MQMLRLYTHYFCYLFPSILPTSVSISMSPYQTLSGTQASCIRMQVCMKRGPVYKAISLSCGTRNTV